MNITAHTQGHYIVEDLHKQTAFPGRSKVLAFRLSYYQPTWMTDVASVVFYVAQEEELDLYYYSIDTKTWFDTIGEMVASLQKWVQQGDKIVARPIVLEPFRASLTLKMLSGDMLALDLDYANIHASPRDQLIMFMQQSGFADCEYVVFDENGAKNLDTDVFLPNSEMNILVQ
uniref:Uncharacterized protein n=1 Tax=viral metagenome TaxID=1070528 RepID=A0A6C0KGB6_9ZZZZ